MLAPLGKPAFIAVPACIEGERPTKVLLHSIVPITVRGAAQTDIGFLAAWSAQNEPLRIAAGPMRMLEKPFAPYAGTSGMVNRCGDGAYTTGLEIATLLPEPGATAVVVDGLEVEYSVNDQRYVERVNVTLGMCARAPKDVAAEPAECPVTAAE
jgi:hypothetical protein